MLFFLGCAPILDDLSFLVTEPRVLAVRVEPAEAEPGGAVSLVALYADASGELADAPVDWAFCTALKPLAELGPIAQSCLDRESETLAPIGTGREVTGALPEDGCSRFGPNPPPPVDGELGGRPTDPDVTGGYYQPALGFPEEGDPTLVQARIRCGLALVDQETYVAWNLGYHSNENPQVTGLALDGVPVDAVEGAVVTAGANVTLTVSWPTCPDTPECGDGLCSLGEDLSTCPEDCETPVGCAGAEGYVAYDAEEGTLFSRREAVSATWFTTGGSFEAARVGRTGDERETSVDNRWTAPDEAGDAWLAVVLRDERGGVGFQGYRVTVAP